MFLIRESVLVVPCPHCLWFSVGGSWLSFVWPVFQLFSYVVILRFRSPFVDPSWSSWIIRNLHLCSLGRIVFAFAIDTWYIIYRCSFSCLTWDATQVALHVVGLLLVILAAGHRQESMHSTNSLESKILLEVGNLQSQRAHPLKPCKLQWKFKIQFLQLRIFCSGSSL